MRSREYPKQGSALVSGPGVIDGRVLQGLIATAVGYQTCFAELERDGPETEENGPCRAYIGAENPTTRRRVK